MEAGPVVVPEGRDYAAARLRNLDKKDYHIIAKARKHEKQKDIFLYLFFNRQGKRIILKFTVIAFQGQLTFNG